MWAVEALVGAGEIPLSEVLKSTSRAHPRPPVNCPRFGQPFGSSCAPNGSLRTPP